MIKVKDGYAKLIGTTYQGSATLVLLSNGGNLEFSSTTKANTLVLRNASLHIYATYFNSAISDEALTDIGSVYVRNTSDTFIRRISKTQFYSIIDNKFVTLDTALTITGAKTFSTGPILANNATITLNLSSTSNYTTVVKWLKGGTSLGTYNPSIGLHNTGGDGKGSICILPYPTETSPWGGTVGLFISKGVLILDGKSVALAENYYTKTESDERYVNVTGDTMTGPLIVKASITGTLLISNIADGTAPLKVTSKTVVTNLNSDLLDGYHETSFFRARGSLTIASSIPTTTELSSNNNLSGNWTVAYPGASGHLVQFNTGGGSTRYMQFYSYYSGSLYWRNSTDSTLSTKSWKTIVDSANYTGIVLKIGTATKGSATLPIYLNAGTPTACSTTLGVSITGNAATATKLLTARTINGTSFNGTANITTAYWGATRTITLSGAVTGSASVNGSLNVTITTTYQTGSIDGRYVGGKKTAGHGSQGTAYTADTYSSNFVNKAFVAYAERGSWAYANNGYITTDTGVNIPLAGTAVFQWGASDTNKTLLFITPHNNSGVSNPAANEMLFYTSNGSVYTSAWTRVLTHRNYTAYTVTKTGGGASGTWGISITGNANTATKLLTARNINGTSFNGSANITTANWGTSRTLTIGSTGKSVNGSANVSWSLAEIGAAVGDNVSYAHNAGSGARWIRIAEFSHYTSYGIISILNGYYNNAPNSVTFYYNSGYRSSASPSITQIGGRAGIFTKARVVYPTSTDVPGFIEVYYNTTSVGNTLHLRLANSLNCKLLRTATVGSVPSTHTSYERSFTSGGISADTVSANTFYGSLSGNASSATKLSNIPTSFTGNYPLTVNVNGTIYSHTGMTFNGTTKNLTATSFTGSLNGNASTSTKLATARTLWGQSFNGTGNVSGNMTGVGSITMSGRITNTGGLNARIGSTDEWANATIFSAGTYPLALYYPSGTANTRKYYYSGAANALTFSSANDANSWVSNIATYYHNGTVTWHGTATFRGDVRVNDKITISSAGRIVPHSSATRSSGVYGVYNPAKIGHIWSMGTGYAIPDNGSTFGNLYGFAYKHTNNTTGGTMGGSHMAVWCIAGVPKASFGDYIWAANGFKKNGSSNSYVLLGGGGHKLLSDLQGEYDGRYVNITGDIMTGNLTAPAFIKSGTTASSVLLAGGRVRPINLFIYSDYGSVGVNERTGNSDDLGRAGFWRDNNLGAYGVTLMHSDSANYQCKIYHDYGNGGKLYMKSRTNGTWGAVYNIWNSGNLNPGNYVTALGTNGDYLTWTRGGTTNNLTVPYSTRSGYLYPIASNPDNSRGTGYGARVFYSWNTGQANNSTTGYSNGITIGAHPSDAAYGFLIVQNLWDDRTYTRRYNSGWQSWKTLAWTTDVKDPANYYWANIKVSASSSTATLPTFNTCYTSNWFRSTGSTGWCSQTYGGGFYMSDTTWIRTYGGKAFYVANNTTNAIYAVGGIKSDNGFYKNGSSDSYVLLGGGGHKLITDFAKGNAGSATKGVYVTGGTVTAMTYSLSSNLNSGTSGKLAYYSSATTVAAYTSSVGATNRGVYMNAGVPTVMTYYLNATVNSGTSGNLAYYSSTNALSSYTTTVGSTHLPVYMSSGVPTICGYSFKGSSRLPIVLLSGVFYRSGTTWYMDSARTHKVVDATPLITTSGARMLITLPGTTISSGVVTLEQTTDFSASSTVAVDQHGNGAYGFAVCSNAADYVYVRTWCQRNDRNHSWTSNGESWAAFLMRIQVTLFGYIN